MNFVAINVKVRDRNARHGVRHVTIIRAVITSSPNPRKCRQCHSPTTVTMIMMTSGSWL